MYFVVGKLKCKNQFILSNRVGRSMPIFIVDIEFETQNTKLFKRSQKTEFSKHFSCISHIERSRGDPNHYRKKFKNFNEKIVKGINSTKRRVIVDDTYIKVSSPGTNPEPNFGGGGII